MNLKKNRCNSFGEKFHIARAAIGETAANIAISIKTSAASLSNIASGRRILTHRIAERLEKYFAKKGLKINFAKYATGKTIQQIEIAKFLAKTTLTKEQSDKLYTFLKKTGIYSHRK